MTYNVLSGMLSLYTTTTLFISGSIMYLSELTTLPKYRSVCLLLLILLLFVHCHWYHETFFAQVKNALRMAVHCKLMLEAIMNMYCRSRCIS